MKIDVAELMRAVVVVDGRPDEYLRPGRYRRWALRKSVDLVWFLTGDLVAEMTEAQVDRVCDALAASPRRPRRELAVGSLWPNLAASFRPCDLVWCRHTPHGGTDQLVLPQVRVPSCRPED